MRVILERYELAVPIASSGRGTLWEGTGRRLDRRIVIKLIRPGQRRDSDAMRRFNREARCPVQLKVARKLTIVLGLARLIWTPGEGSVRI